MNENKFHMILALVASMFLSIVTVWWLGVLFMGAVVLYVVSSALGEMAAEHHAAKVRAEQVAFEAYLHTHINDHRQALPFNAWADSKWDADLYDAYQRTVHPDHLDY